MPRRAAKRDSDPSEERRVTRRSLRGAVPVEEPKETSRPSRSRSARTRQTKEPSPSPVKASPPSGRSRGRGGGRSRSRRGRPAKGEHVEEEEEESAEEEKEEAGEESEEVAGDQKDSPPARGRRGRPKTQSHAGSSTGPRSTGRRGKASAPEQEEDAGDTVPAEVTTSPSPRKSRSSPRAQPSVSPRRRSGRGASKPQAAEGKAEAEEPMESEAGPTAEVTPSTTEESRGMKRKLEEEKVAEEKEELESKKPKIIETDDLQDVGDMPAKHEGPPPKVEETPPKVEEPPVKVDKGEDKAMETSDTLKDNMEMSSEPTPAKSAEILPEAPTKEAAQPPPMKILSEPVAEVAESKASAEAAELKTTVSPTTAPTVTLEAKPLVQKEAGTAPCGTQSLAPADEVAVPVVAGALPVKEALDKKAASAPVAPTVSQTTESTVAAHTANEPEPMEEDKPLSPPKLKSDVETAPTQELDDFVMVNMEDVPAADSAEVTKVSPSPRIEPGSGSVEAPPAAPCQGGNGDREATTTVEQESAALSERVPQANVIPDSSLPQEGNGSIGAPMLDQMNQKKTVESVNNGCTEDASTQENALGDSHKVTPSNNIDSVIDAGATIPEPLFHRQFVANPNLNCSPTEQGKRFSVVSYNILADCHAQKADYHWISPEHLSQEYRHKKFLQELQYLDSDILCLQEVGPEYFSTVLQPTLKALGYEGVFEKRPDIHFNEGGATFYRTSRFSLLQHKGVILRDQAYKELETSGLEEDKKVAIQHYIDQPAVVLITQFRCSNTGAVLTVGNFHASWGKLKTADLRCIQVACAIKECVTMADGPNNAYVLCGDFNSGPGSPVYQLTKEGYLNDESMASLQAAQNVTMPDGSMASLVNLWWKGFQHTSTNMRSAYASVLDQEPVTCVDKAKGLSHQKDYVWLSGNSLDICGVLQTVPMSKDSPNIGIPNASFPSDHLSLKADLFFK